MIKIKKVTPWVNLPKLGSDGAAAFDVTWCPYDFENGCKYVEPGEVEIFSTGLAFELPPNLAMLVLPRSGLASKQRLRPANTPGLLDSDYRGELKIALENFGSERQRIAQGDRIAQIMFVPIGRPTFEIVDDLTPTDRGEGGFGSTGV